MDYQHFTISFARDTLRKAKVIAASKETSVSAIVRGLLEEYVTENDAYELAKDSYLSLLRNPADMGTKGQLPWRRSDLHERQ